MDGRGFDYRVADAPNTLTVDILGYAAPHDALTLWELVVRLGIALGGSVDEQRRTDK